MSPDKPPRLEYNLLDSLGPRPKRTLAYYARNHHHSDPLRQHPTEVQLILREQLEPHENDARLLRYKARRAQLDAVLRP